MKNRLVTAFANYRKEELMLLPLRHENMEGRRWPVVTFALIALNVIAFLGTHWTMESQNPERAEVRMHLLLLAAMHPELQVPPSAQQFVSEFAAKNPDTWKQASSQYRPLADAWDARIRMVEDTAKLQEEMDSLGERFAREEETSVVAQYAFVPAHPRGITYITANFLHGGWLHLIGNMWFLWLAGFILEENWGRIIYPIFYLLAGAAALQFHAWMYPGSLIPALGASGAVAALMGAFLVRFPKLKIEMLWITGLFFRTYRFKAQAYWLLPVWLLTEVFSGALFGQSSGVAHWAHVGGFLFGALAALAIKHSGLEHRANQVIEAKVGWSAEPEIAQAGELLGEGKVDEAIGLLERFLSTHPESEEGLTLLQQSYWRKNNLEGFRATAIKLCQLHLKKQDTEGAWNAYNEFSNAAGGTLPAATWLDLCRSFENAAQYDRAAAEYAKLAEACPTERPALLAALSAGRLSLKRLNRPEDALKFYQLAAKSPVPHLDWEPNIQQGIRESQNAMAGVPVNAAPK